MARFLCFRNWKIQSCWKACQWWRAKEKDNYTFADLAVAFERTTLRLLLKWKRMTELVQHKSEPLNPYFHENVRLGADLCLTFADTKEQVLIRLYDRSICSANAEWIHSDNDDRSISRFS
ncbi:hypothetical protein Trydic_g9611 [Trypoxylus dichotomus]